MEPINYAMDVEGPIRSTLAGYALGSNVRENQLQASVMQQKLADADRARLANEQVQRELTELSQNPSATGNDYIALMTRYPQLSENLKRGWEAKNTEQKQSNVLIGSQAYAAMQSGRPDLAEKLFRDRAAAALASGDEAEAKGSETMANIIKESPQVGMAMVSAKLAAVDPDKFAENIGKLGQEGRAAELHTPALAKATADADKAGSDAKTAAVTAEYAPQMARAEIDKMAADLGLTKAQTTQAHVMTKKLNGDIQRAVLEASTGDPAKKFDAEKKLRDEYAKGTAGAIDTTQAYQRVLASKDDAVGDLSLIFGYMKMLDPGSVVREGEFANAQNAAGVPERVANVYNRLMRGERLTPGQRTAFKGQAKELNTVAERRMKDVRDTLDPVIKSYKLDSKNVYGSPTDPAAPPPAPVPAGVPKDVADLLSKYGGKK